MYALKRFGRSLAGVEKVEKGLEVSWAACDVSVGVCFGVCAAGAGCDLRDENVDCGLNRLLELFASGWNVCENMPELGFGPAVNSPP